ncbi:MAG: hypothetical protein HOP33_19580 [Verrucomicrobia bacterium]|nr:hypothetical protein [Verrucomicrobiota bacterium]
MVGAVQLRFKQTFSFVAALIALSTGFAAPQTNHWRAFTKADGLRENSCVSVTVGAGGNILVRHSRLGSISIFDGYEFSTLPAPGTNRGRLYESPGGQLWTVTRDGLLEFRDGEWSPHPVPQVAAHFRAGRTNEVRLQPIRQGRVLILLPEETLQLDSSDPEHLQIDAVSKPVSTNILVGELFRETAQLPDVFSVRRVFDVQAEPSGAVWFATSDGLFRRAGELWEAIVAPVGIMPRSVSVARSDVPEGIKSHTDWKARFDAKNGDIWLGGASEIAWRHQNVWGIFSSTNQVGPEEVIGFAESPDGRFWCSTPNKVWEFDGKNWLMLRGGFDSINALHCSRDGTLWVAAVNGVHRFAQGRWIANGTEDGLPAVEVRSIHEDAVGGIAIETTRGWSAFHPGADTDVPRTYIVSTPPGEAHYREGAVVTIAFRGCDKWKQTLPDRLLFSYRLDEREWSPFQELNEVFFTDLPLGKHYFQVRTLDRAGNIDPKPARLEFTMVVPWYQETRLVLILTVALGVAIFFAALAFNRHRKLQRSYAEVERQIAERTRELEVANRELLHGQKMNALGSLAAGIAHDFNNILSIIKGSAQIIEDNADKPDKIRTRVDRIKTVVQQGAEVVDAMLGFSRSTDQPPAPCDLNAVVDETRKLLGDRFLREVEVRFERGQGLPQLSVRRDFVQQILLNFIFNAAEAMTSRKQITLTTKFATTLPPELFLTPVVAENYILISVRDNGSGIPPDIKPRIFEPFFTTKALSTKRGTGLGLSMVYELAKKMEAGLAVESVVGQGSTFTLILPVREPETTP